MDTIMPDLIHPVDPELRSQILHILDAIEQRFGVRILYACETGSRGWGFSSPDSDYDVRFIYIHSLDWYLRVSPGRDVIELPIEGLLDINGWELRKALGLLKKGNATLVEWISSPIVYRQNDGFYGRLREVSEKTHRPERSFHHYLHMAKGNFRGYLLGDHVRLKKYLYVLRPVLACLWIERGLGVVPMRFESLVDGIVDEPRLRKSIDRLLVHKRAASETEYGGTIPEINAFLQRELTRLESNPPDSTQAPDDTALDRLLYEFATRNE